MKILKTALGIASVSLIAVPVAVIAAAAGITGHLPLLLGMTVVLGVAFMLASF